MRTSDPRLWGLKKPRAMLLAFLGLTLLFAWGNTRVERGGILDKDVILREDDPSRQMDRYVQGKVEEGFEGREFIPFILNHGSLRSPEDLREVLRFTEAARGVFGDTVFSLSRAPAYQDTGETLLDEPYVTLEELSRPDFTLERWKEKVAADPGVFGLLVGRDFSWTAVIRYLSPGYDEIGEFRKTAEFLEGRKIPPWEWLWKKDIAPQNPAVGVGGWTMGRGLIDQGLNVDILTMIFLGMFLTLPVFWAALGSARAAVLCVGVVVVGGFVWTRGAMGLLGLHERVYSLLAYANVIVQGTSFALHKFEAFRESGTGDRVLGWQRARSVDGLIATTAGIAAFGFATLWSFGLKPIRELGLASALGVVWILLLAVFFLPALCLLGGERWAPSDVTSLKKSCRWFERALAYLVSCCLRPAVWLAAGRRPWGVVAFVCTLFGAVTFLFAQGYIVSRTRALEFVRGTLVEREARFLNRAGNVGFEFLDFLVEPTRGGGIADPHFLRRAWGFQAALRNIPGTREVTSILSPLRQIARESFKKELPETEEEVAAAFFLIEHRLSPAIQRQLYFPGGVRVAASSGLDDSVELGRFRDRVLALARADFPDLRVNAFNKNALYPQVDTYVRQGKVSNVFVSQAGVALICGLLISWRNRRLTRVRLSPLWGGLVMSLPLCFATAVMGLVMWALEIPLDMSTAAIGALAINAATDFSLYLAMTYHAALKTLPPVEAFTETVGQQGRVILADCLLNTLCFLPLVTSHFLPVRQLGWMMGVTLVACAVGTLILMAALLPGCVVGKAGVRKGQSREPLSSQPHCPPTRQLVQVRCVAPLQRTHGPEVPDGTHTRIA